MSLAAGVARVGLVRLEVLCTEYQVRSTEPDANLANRRPESFRTLMRGARTNGVHGVVFPSDSGATAAKSVGNALYQAFSLLTVHSWLLFPGCDKLALRFR